MLEQLRQKPSQTLFSHSLAAERLQTYDCLRRHLGIALRLVFRDVVTGPIGLAQ
jgi:hypothetical protein